MHQFIVDYTDINKESILVNAAAYVHEDNFVVFYDDEDLNVLSINRDGIAMVSRVREEPEETETDIEEGPPSDLRYLC